MVSGTRKMLWARVPVWGLLIFLSCAQGCFPYRVVYTPGPVAPRPQPTPPPPDPIPVPKPAPPEKRLAYHAPVVVNVDCPVAGNAVSGKAKADNVAKNRTTEPDHYDFVPIDSLLAASRGDFSESMGVYTVGYISGIKYSGAETCNCGSKTERDIHIELVPSPDDIGDNTRKMIVEITPRLEINFTYSQLKKLSDNRVQVRVFGWLFFDNEHVGAKWRGTEWEIHPITDIEIAD